MLFNSVPFIFVFLPVLLLGFIILGALDSRRASLRWIVVCSMVFYGIWIPTNLVLIMASIIVNYLLATQIRTSLEAGVDRERLANLLLTIGIIGNLCFLGYFKYKNFFADSINDVFGLSFELTRVALPLGISFITFQKIGFLIDVRAQTIKKFSLDNFFVFVFFFPQLIAGPIVHYREMMPQFEKIRLRLDPGNISIGICLFSLGLFKKVVLADGIAAYVSPGFTAASQGEPLALFAAWTSALGYTFQVYFDFSGYTDMALGLARLFGIRLPMNFNSPLKASSMIEFWGRWHITLTRFLTAYIYTPLVIKLTRARMHKGKTILANEGSSLGAFLILVSIPTMLTMLISGFWHGAGYTFIIWGGIHGLLLIVNHSWRQWHSKWLPGFNGKYLNSLAFVLTFLSVVVTMVVFRAESATGAFVIYQGMLGLNGVSVPSSVLNQLGPVQDIALALGVTADLGSGTYFSYSVVWIIALYCIAIFAPNSMEIMRRFEPALYFESDPEATSRLRDYSAKLQSLIFAFRNRWAISIALAFIIAALSLSRPSEFLYWQF